MSREKESYRDILCRISEKYPGQEILNLRQAADYMGTSYQRLERLADKKQFPAKKCGKWQIHICDLARHLAY